MNPALFSSVSFEWGTPKDLFKDLDREFHFTLDPCASPQNAKCKHFFTRADNGLEQDWGQETVFMNPPYGRQVVCWMRKAYWASRTGATVVCLVPARTDTQWWHDYSIQGEIRFLKGRLHFELFIGEESRKAVMLAETEGQTVADIMQATHLPKMAVQGILEGAKRLTEAAPFPSAVVVFRPATSRRIAQLAAQIAARIPEMAKDCATNNEAVLTTWLEDELR